MIAGAGFAGVETIAELQELVAGALRRHPRLAGVTPRWILVDPAQRILGQTPDGLAGFAARTLSRRGIEILTGTALDSVDETGALLSDGRRIDSHTVVWTAGVKANPLLAKLGLPCDERGRVLVDETLQVVGMPGVWSLGDGAAVPKRGDAGRARPADVPARAAPGPSARAQPARHRSPTATARAARWPRSAAATALR